MKRILFSLLSLLILLTAGGTAAQEPGGVDATVA